jgi:hypothetical protein
MSVPNAGVLLMDKKRAAVATALTATGISFITGALAAPETRVPNGMFYAFFSVGIAMIVMGALVAIRLNRKLHWSIPPFCIHNATTDTDERRVYLQVVPLTKAPVEQCRGQLLRVKKWAGHDWQSTELDHALSLVWSYGSASPLTLDPGVDARLNVFWRNDKGQLSLETSPQTYAINSVFRSSDTFRFDLYITAKECLPIGLSLKVYFGEQWDDIQVERL